MKKYLFSHRKNFLSMFLLNLSGILLFCGHPVFAADKITLYTPYTKISVPPGESIDYIIDVINNSNEIQNVEISLEDLPRGWNYVLKSGGWKISQIAVLPGGKQTLNLILDVPLQVNKGSYRFKVDAKGFDSLPLTVTVSEQGTFKTEFTTRQSNLQGPTTSNFTFEAIIKNLTADNQLYSLNASAPQGWIVNYSIDFKQISSVSVDANKSKSLSVQIVPPGETKAGTYKIHLNAVTTSTSANLELEVVITGSYNMVLTTPTGLLSDNIAEGEEKKLKLLVRNTGSSDLKDIRFNSSAPVNWEVTFDPKKVDRLESGESAQIYAIIKVAKRAIVGDYITRIEANSQGVNSKAEFRISVRTPMLLGWTGILIILCVFGAVFYLFRRYGRR
ncbi:MAG: NEW3 domain-containing protein [Bacteroidales bacterium]